MYSHYIPTNDTIISRTGSRVEMLTLTEAKNNLGLRSDDNLDDDLITALISSAHDYLDVPNGVLGRSLTTQTWVMSIPCANSNGHIVLPYSPVQSVSSISYFDSDEVSQDLSVSDFYLYKSEEFAYLDPKAGVSWPSTHGRRDAITVTFVCGYGDASAVPKTIYQLSQLLVAHWYEHRTPVVVGQTPSSIPLSVENIINLHRRGWVA